MLYLFGRPNLPFAPNKKATAIRRPSDIWALTDCDQQLLLSLGISSASYQGCVPVLPVHGGPTPAHRQYLLNDWSVHSLRTPK